MIRAFLILILCSVPLYAAIRIGSEAQLTVPPSAHYSTLLNVRPGAGEVVSNNPPTFSWFYNTNHLEGGELAVPNTQTLWTNEYQLQIATNADFTGTLQADVSSAFPWYNWLPVLNTNASRQMWWRVKYVRNGTPYWTNNYTFTIAGGATNWNRAMFADTNFLATNSAAHPVFAFRAGEEQQIFSWVTNDADWVAVSNAAVACTNASWFKTHTLWGTNSGPNPNSASANPADGLDRIAPLLSALSYYRLSGDNRWTNESMRGWLFTNLSHAVEWYSNTNNNWMARDWGSAGMGNFPFLIIATYDWLYNDLGSDTGTFNGQLRTNAAYAIEKTLEYLTWSQGLWSDQANGSGPPIRADGYPSGTNSSAPIHYWTKFPFSHLSVTLHSFMPMIVATADRGGYSKLTFDWMFNYMLARTTPYAGFAAHHAGPYGYTSGHTFLNGTQNGIIDAAMVLDVGWPQAQLYRSDFAQRFPEWYADMFPHKARRWHGPYGDGSNSSDNNNAGRWGIRFVGEDMASVFRSGISENHYALNAAYHFTAVDAYPVEMIMRWHYTNRPALTTGQLAKVYIEDGYVVAASRGASDPGRYTNGVGFSMRARPRGSVGGHDSWSEGSVDMWAYGAQITDGGGAGLNNYDYYTESSPSLMVNGIGQYPCPVTQGSPTLPVYSKILAFTNDGHMVYTCADITGQYQTACMTTYNNFPTNLVTKVRRHILFDLQHKYWMFYDEFGTISNATFMWRWHVPWVFRYSEGAAMANEIKSIQIANQYGSNSLVMTTNGFTYVAGNYTDATYNDVPPRIPVTVMFANATNQYGFFVATGTNNLHVTTNTANGSYSTNSTLNPFVNGGETHQAVNPDRAAGMWGTNRVPGTNFFFNWALGITPPGGSAPVFTALQDNVIKVDVGGGVIETNAFGTNYSGALTYEVDLDAPPNQGQEPSAPPPRIGNVRELRASIESSKNPTGPWNSFANINWLLGPETEEYFRVKMEVRPKQ